MIIEITESATDEIAEGYLFYEMQQSGLGDYFESTILSEIRSLLVHGGAHEIHLEKYHRKITRRFPYAIYYRVEDEVIRVYAVLDTRKNPELISDKLN